MLVCSKYRKSLENLGKMLIVLSESGMLMGCWERCRCRVVFSFCRRTTFRGLHVFVNREVPLRPEL